MPEPRCLFGLASDENFVYICGGGGILTARTPSLWRYNPLSNEYSHLGNMSFPRSSFDLTLWNGSLYAFGGGDGAPGRSWEVYSLSEERWTVSDPPPYYIYPLTECENVGESFYFFSTRRGALERFDILNGSMQNIAPLDYQHRYYSTAFIDGRLFTFGGYLADVPVGLTKIFHLETNSWSTGMPMPTARGDSAAVQVNDMIYVIGGIDDTESETNIVEAYCPFNDTWVQMRPMLHSRAFFRGAFIDGCIYLFGGANTNKSSVFNSAESYPVPLPDLEVNETNVQLLHQGEIVEGQNITINIKISNSGNWPARNFVIEHYIDGILVKTSMMEYLGVGESTTTELSWVAETGTHEISLNLDPKGDISEYLESNNGISFPLEIHPAQPDLWVNSSSMDIKERNYSAGDIITIVVNVSNHGFVPAEIIDWCFTVDGISIADGRIVQNLEPGKTIMISIPWETSEGYHEICISVECEPMDLGILPNSFLININVPRRPDLVLSRPPIVVPSVVTTGEEVEFFFKISNIGEVPVFNIEVSILYQGVIWETFLIDTLKPNGSHEDSRLIRTSGSDSGVISISLDPSDEIWEYNENNNYESVEFEVLDKINGNDNGSYDKFYWIPLIVIFIMTITAIFTYFHWRRRRV